MPLNPEGLTPAAAEKRLVDVHGDRLHARHGAKTVEQLPHDDIPARRFGVPTREHQIRGHRLARVHADVDLVEPHEAAHQESSADQQHDGERCLRDDQQIAEAMLPRSAGLRAPILLQKRS